MYALEINCDVGFGLSQIVFNIFLLMQSLFSETIMTKVGTANFFFIFGAVMAVSVIYFIFYIGETKHLTDKEKKELYVPGAKYGRELKL